MDGTDSQWGREQKVRKVTTSNLLLSLHRLEEPWTPAITPANLSGCYSLQSSHVSAEVSDCTSWLGASAAIVLRFVPELPVDRLTQRQRQTQTRVGVMQGRKKRNPQIKTGKVQSKTSNI